MTNASAAVLLEHANSPYPASFDGNGILFATALFSVTAIACLSSMIAGWMARDLWRDRFTIHPKSPIFSFRLIVMFVGVVGVMRSGPEAAYLFLYNEPRVTPALYQFVLIVKRLSDTLSIVPVVAWMALLTVSYAGIVHQMKACTYISPDRLGPWPNLVRPFLVLIIVLSIAFLVAIGK